jgi:hypothetical protein
MSVSVDLSVLSPGNYVINRDGALERVRDNQEVEEEEEEAAAAAAPVKRFVCAMCTQLFASPQDCREHMRIDHANAENAKNAENGRVPDQERVSQVEVEASSTSSGGGGGGGGDTATAKKR